MSPTTAPSDGPAELPPAQATTDPSDPDAQARWAQGPMEILVEPPEGNPPLPFVTWPVPPQGLEEIQ